MSSNLRRLAALAAVCAVGALAPVTGASAATQPAHAKLGFILPDYFGPGLGGFVAPQVFGGAAAVIGPTVYTVGAGNVFVQTTITTSGGGAIVAAGPTW
jgi:hypothetical protein